MNDFGQVVGRWFFTVVVVIALPCLDIAVVGAIPGYLDTLHLYAAVLGFSFATGGVLVLGLALAAVAGINVATVAALFVSWHGLEVNDGKA